MTTSSALYDISGSSSDGDLLTTEMRWQHSTAYLSVVFYSDSELTTPVTPSAGTITFEASEDGVDYGTITDGSVNPTGQYDRPNFAGTARFVKATCLGITGAPFYKAVVYRGEQ